MKIRYSYWQRHLIWLCLLGILWSCKETKPAPVQTNTEIQEPKPIGKELKEVLDFAGISATNSEELTTLINLFEINESGTVQSMSPEKANTTLKQIKTSKKLDQYPIIEIQDTDHVVFVFQGRGYGGPIWAKALFNRGSMSFEKIQFDHKAESEGYGDGITYSNFEDQFTKKTLVPETEGFQLNVEGKDSQPGFYPVDGISGATQSSKAVIDMMNYGLSVYNSYLFPKN